MKQGPTVAILVGPMAESQPSKSESKIAKNYQMGLQCCVYGCKKRKKSRLRNRSDSEGSEDEESALKRCQPRTFHSFPNDPERRKAWIAGVHREKWKPSIHSRVCSDHFKECDMDRTGQNVRLRSEAIPTRIKTIPKHLRIKTIKSRKPPFYRWKVIESQEEKKQPKNIVVPEDTPYETSRASPMRKEIVADHQYFNPKGSPKRNMPVGDHEYCIRDSPIRLTGKLQACNEKIEILKKKLKHEQQKSRRLQIRVKSLKDLVKSMRKKQRQLEFAVSQEILHSENITLKT